VSEEVNDVIRAKRFELVNDEGQVRAVLAARPEGNVGLWFVGASSTTIRASLGISSDDVALLNLFDEQQRLRANVVVDASGAHSIMSLRDEVGRAIVQLSHTKDHGAGVIVSNQWGHRRVAVQVNEGGHPSLLFFDEDGNVIGGEGLRPPSTGQDQG
jgi:hypothetical protein